MKNAMTVVWFLIILMVSFDSLRSAAIGNTLDVSDKGLSDKNVTASGKNDW
jgi:hypothetical protein